MMKGAVVVMVDGPGGGWSSLLAMCISLHSVDGVSGGEMSVALEEERACRVVIGVAGL